MNMGGFVGFNALTRFGRRLGQPLPGNSIDAIAETAPANSRGKLTIRSAGAGTYVKINCSRLCLIELRSSTGKESHLAAFEVL